MPYSPTDKQGRCPFCGAVANAFNDEFKIPTVVNCTRCGDFAVTFEAVEEWRENKNKNPYLVDVTSHLIRQMQTGERPKLSTEFVRLAIGQSLPSPAEQADNLLLYMAKVQGPNPGKSVDIVYDSGVIQATIGCGTYEDVEWIVDNWRKQAFIAGAYGGGVCNIKLTMVGWERVQQLQRNEIDSKYSFFARKFANLELDQAFSDILLPATKEAGYELRPATQRAGIIDANIEDEIRRCKFLIADLSDENEGAYWEAGFAEGLGKPVIYVAKGKNNVPARKIHFDANHRHTVFWEIEDKEKCVTTLTAVIRNTLAATRRMS